MCCPGGWPDDIRMGIGAVESVILVGHTRQGELVELVAIVGGGYGIRQGGQLLAYLFAVNAIEKAIDLFLSLTGAGPGWDSSDMLK